MKKTLLLMFAFLGGIMAQAQNTVTYTDDLVVTINEESTEPQKTDIKVTTNADGTYTLALDNFMLGAGEDALAVGNIVLENITGTEENGRVLLNVTQTIQIAPGTDETIPEEAWLGPMLGDVPVVLKAEMTADKMYCMIDIDMMATIEQVINVVFGTPFGEVVEPDEPEVLATYTYTDDLVVTINEESTEPQKTDIMVNKHEDGTYTLMLDNFMLGAGEDALAVGNIVLKNITGTEENGRTNLNVTQTIQIAPGTDETIPEEAWLGPMLGDVPVVLKAEMTADKMYCTIDIDMMATIEQVINVVFGSPFKEEGGNGIQTVTSFNKERKAIYNLNGVCVGTDWNALQQGVYIVNGKKVIK